MPAFTKKNYTFRHVNGLPPIHPGEILREEFLRPIFPADNSPMGFDVHEAARRIGIHAIHLKALLCCMVSLTVEDAFCLARYFGMQIDVWLNMQEAYAVKCFEKTAMFKTVQAIKPHPKKNGVLVILPKSKKALVPVLTRATALIREAQDLISTNDPGQPLIRQLEAFLKEMGVKTVDESAAMS